MHKGGSMVESFKLLPGYAIQKSRLLKSITLYILSAIAVLTAE